MLGDRTGDLKRAFRIDLALFRVVLVAQRPVQLIFERRHVTDTVDKTFLAGLVDVGPGFRGMLRKDVLQGAGGALEIEILAGTLPLDLEENVARHLFVAAVGRGSSFSPKAALNGPSSG